MTNIPISLYRFAYKMHKMGIPIIPKMVIVLNRVLFGCYIGLGAIIGEKIKLGYGGLGVVIHHEAIIGNNVEIATGVVIGGNGKKRGVPIIGNDVIIGAGAKILGPVFVSDCAIIGANAVVIKDIKESEVAVGVPAIAIKKKL